MQCEHGRVALTDIVNPPQTIMINTMKNSKQCPANKDCTEHDAGGCLLQIRCVPSDRHDNSLFHVSLNRNCTETVYTSRHLGHLHSVNELRATAASSQWAPQGLVRLMLLELLLQTTRVNAIRICARPISAHHMQKTPPDFL